MTLKKIRDAIHADSYSSNGGVFTLRWAERGYSQPIEVERVPLVKL